MEDKRWTKRGGKLTTSSCPFLLQQPASYEREGGRGRGPGGAHARDNLSVLLYPCANCSTMRARNESPRLFPFCNCRRSQSGFARAEGSMLSNCEERGFNEVPTVASRTTAARFSLPPCNQICRRVREGFPAIIRRWASRSRLLKGGKAGKVSVRVT